MSTRILFLLFLIPALAIPRGLDTTCGTTNDRRLDEILKHQQALLLNPKAAALKQSTTTLPDQGDIAVMTEADGVVARRNVFNLQNRRIRFTLESGTYRFAASDATLDEEARTQGTRVTLLDDDTSAQNLPFAFPFYGSTYRNLNVNSDGNLTFNGGDTDISERTLGRLASGLPRIAALFRDLNPETSGQVRVFSTPERYVITWDAVRDFSTSGFGPINTFQIRLFPNGDIEFLYAGIATQEAVVGITPGGARAATRVVRFNEGSSETFTGTIAERFTLRESVDLVAAAQKFYLNHDDAYDFLYFYNALDLPASSGAVAFMVSVRNRVTAINDPVVDDGALYGSPRRLKGVINMGPLSQYPVNPNGPVSARSGTGDTPLTVLAHEAGHLWLAFVSTIESNGALPMLNSQNFAHWNFLFNSEASLMEGNRIQDLGDGANPRFLTTATVEGFAPLDQYLMGLRARDDVPPSFFVRQANLFNVFPQVGVRFNGQRRDVAVQELESIYGRRTPDHTVAQRRFRFAFIVIGPDPLPAAALAQVEGYRAAYAEAFQRYTQNRAFAEPEIRRELTLNVEPAAGVLATREITGRLSIRQPAESTLNIKLNAEAGVEVPGTVSIAAGATSATFPIAGRQAGVAVIRASASDPKYMNAEARVQVRSTANELTWRVTSGAGQPVQNPGSPLPNPITVRLTDINDLPYPGLPISVQVNGGGSITGPATTTTDENGAVSLRWTPGSGPVNQLIFSSPGIEPFRVSALGRPALESANAVVDAAAFRPGMVPGSLASVFGINLAPTPQGATLPLPTRLNGVRLLVNGAPANLLFVGETQINFLVPEGLTAGTAQIQVENAVGTSNAVAAQVFTERPAIFFDAASGIAAALVNGTSAITSSRPIAAGEILEIYCTGLGAFSDPATSTLRVPLRVTVGGVHAEVLFAGLAPGFNGLYQVNVRIPAGVPPGRANLQLVQGDQTSNEPQIVIR